MKELCVTMLYVQELCELCVTRSCAKEWCVTMLCVKELCVKELCVKMLCDRAGEAGRRRMADGSAQQKSKNRTQIFGEKWAHLYC